MKLWLLERRDEDVDYDEHDAAVVRAETEEEARALANANQAPPHDYLPVLYPPGIWSDPGKVRCTPLLNLGEPGVILSSFNAG